jgi:hypothetical protein
MDRQSGIIREIITNVPYSERRELRRNGQDR